MLFLLNTKALIEFQFTELSFKLVRYATQKKEAKTAFESKLLILLFFIMGREITKLLFEAFCKIRGRAEAYFITNFINIIIAKFN